MVKFETCPLNEFCNLNYAQSDASNHNGAPNSMDRSRKHGTSRFTSFSYILPIRRLTCAFRAYARFSSRKDNSTTLSASPILPSNDPRSPGQPSLQQVHPGWKRSRRRSRCRHVFTCLGDDAAIMETVGTICKSRESINGNLYVDCSTVHRDTTNQIAATLFSHGAEFVACPVFGTPAMADTRQLVCVFAGLGTRLNESFRMVRRHGPRKHRL